MKSQKAKKKQILEIVKNKSEIDNIELSELLKMEHQQALGLLN